MREEKRRIAAVDEGRSIAKNREREERFSRDGEQRVGSAGFSLARLFSRQAGTGWDGTGRDW